MGDLIFPLLHHHTSHYTTLSGSASSLVFDANKQYLALDLVRVSKGPNVFKSQNAGKAWRKMVYKSVEQYCCILLHLHN